MLSGALFAAVTGCREVDGYLAGRIVPASVTVDRDRLVVSETGANE